MAAATSGARRSFLPSRRHRHMLRVADTQSPDRTAPTLQLGVFRGRGHEAVVRQSIRAQRVLQVLDEVLRLPASALIRSSIGEIHGVVGTWDLRLDGNRRNSRTDTEISRRLPHPRRPLMNAPSWAAAGSRCPGRRIEHIPVKSGSRTLGFLDIFFDSVTGNNCAMTVATGNVSGHATFINVCLFRCKQTSPGPTCTFDAVQCDSGAFHFFAGPVSVHAPRRCISAFGDITFRGATGSGKLSGAKHCR